MNITQPMATLIRALLVWALFILLESAQGALRRAMFGLDLPMLVRQVSVGAGVLIVFVLAWLSSDWLGLRSQAGALAVGVLWVTLTLIFEATIAAASGSPWAVAADYDPRRGGLMAFGMLAISLAPWLVQRLRRAHPLIRLKVRPPVRG